MTAFVQFVNIRFPKKRVYMLPNYVLTPHVKNKEKYKLPAEPERILLGSLSDTGCPAKYPTMWSNCLNEVEHQ